MHTVCKETSTTTKIRAVFDASAKSFTGVSLNDTLLVGPTVHPPLIDVRLRFRSHCVASVADVSQMYRAVRLTDTNQDYHRFVWRKCPKDPLKDYRMTRVTFGVSASLFIANMCVQQNAVDHALTHSHASKVVENSSTWMMHSLEQIQWKKQ
uniref:Reverse transcriptase domain-containing protein n=1 Tax=Amphimedon queenslandica TaxID=400682 RepID=A0A1X7VHG3_AMPQE